MRVPSLLLVLSIAALAGCRREPDFDERYKAASGKIGQTARAIDAEVAGTGAPTVPPDGQPDTAGQP